MVSIKSLWSSYHLNATHIKPEINLDISQLIPNGNPDLGKVNTTIVIQCP